MASRAASCAAVLAVACALASLALPAAGWWDVGHMVTASIAQQRVSRAVAERARRLIDASAFAQAPVDVPSTNLVSAAHWADNVKHIGALVETPSGSFVDYSSNYFSTMHFWNLQIEGPDGFRCESVVKDRYNVIDALRMMARVLADGSAPDWSRGVALRFFIHFVGDLHQPLHVSTRCSEAHPQGDNGGNFFPLKGDRYGNLHAVWDSVGGKWPHLEDLCPFGNATACAANEPDRVREVESIALSLVADHPGVVRSVWEADDTPEAWADEARDLAVAYAYANITENAAPSEAYMATCQRIGAEQLVKGGERLAVLLERHLGDAAPGGGGAAWGVMRTLSLVVLGLSSVVGVLCCAVSIAVMVRRGRAARPGEEADGDVEVEYSNYHRLPE